MEGFARVSKNAGKRPRVVAVAFDGRFMGLAIYDWEGLLGHKRPACMLLFVFLRDGLFYSLPLRERGRSSCPVKAFYGSGAEQ